MLLEKHRTITRRIMMSDTKELKVDWIDLTQPLPLCNFCEKAVGEIKCSNCGEYSCDYHAARMLDSDERLCQYCYEMILNTFY